MQFRLNPAHATSGSIAIGEFAQVAEVNPDVPHTKNDGGHQPEKPRKRKTRGHTNTTAPHEQATSPMRSNTSSTLLSCAAISS